ncbi:MAG: hypothetical protein FJ216_00525 [Ignavibacteria bacterium]|nr:hypothetical protein [Ignavibacteria bacterium]
MDFYILSLTAATIGFFHTILGPDHYLPFVVMARARKWSNLKTFWITFVCGLGHIGSSVIIGLAGIALGIAVSYIEEVESVRGDITAWLIIAFGLVYMIWGIKKAVRNKPHTHLHSHGDTVHTHTHTHNEEHIHIHEKEKKVNITPWVLFTIFVFGPCEPLVPILMYPAAKESVYGTILVTAIFGATTIATMLASVFILKLGVNLVSISKLEKYTHAIAGFVILLCGLSIQFLGL